MVTKLHFSKILVVIFQKEHLIKNPKIFKSLIHVTCNESFIADGLEYKIIVVWQIEVLFIKAVLFRLTNKIPVAFHNLPQNDSHFKMQKMVKFGRNINVIPNNMENCMAFMIGKNWHLLTLFNLPVQAWKVWM